MPGSSAVTPSLYAGLQLILPGEVAPAHRHTQCALRFVMEGDGAFTAVDGERAVMAPVDLVLTPNWQWHDHGNDSGRPMIWLDGLDIPTVRFYDASFAERLDTPSQSEALAAGDSMRRYGRNMRPFRATAADRRPAAPAAVPLPLRRMAREPAGAGRRRGAGPASRPRHGVREPGRWRPGHADHRRPCPPPARRLRDAPAPRPRTARCWWWSRAAARRGWKGGSSRSRSATCWWCPPGTPWSCARTAGWCCSAIPTARRRRSSACSGRSGAAA